MHDALTVPEIAEAIFNKLNTKSSLALARSCRALLEPGLDRLWRRLYCFEQIMACLPADLGRLVKPEHHVYAILVRHCKLWCPTRAVKEEDLKRYLEFYAPRVREFDCQSLWKGRKGYAIFTPEAFDSFRCLTNGRRGALTPNLKSFTWWWSDALHMDLGEEISFGYMPFMDLFMGDGVVSLRIPHLDHKREIGSVVSALKLLPQLERLELTTFPEVPEILEVIVEEPLEQMKHLKIGRVTPEVVAHLASLPRLEHLDITYLATSRTDSTPPAVPPGSFSSLTTLLIESQLTSKALAFFKILSPANLIETLRIHVTHRTASKEEVEAAFELMEHHFNPSTLHSFTWTEPGKTYDPDEVPTSGDPNQSIPITPLFRFAELQHLQVNINQTVRLTRVDVKRMIPAWPHLTSLDLIRSSLTFQPPFIDHTDVLTLLEGCPFLTHLGLRFDASRVTYSDKSPQAPFALEKFRVDGKAPISHPPCVVGFFKQNFVQTMRLVDARKYDEYSEFDEDAGYDSRFHERWYTVVEEWEGCRIYPDSDLDVESDSDEEYY